MDVVGKTSMTQLLPGHLPWWTREGKGKEQKRSETEPLSLSEMDMLLCWFISCSVEFTRENLTVKIIDGLHSFRDGESAPHRSLTTDT